MNLILINVFMRFDLRGPVFIPKPFEYFDLSFLLCSTCPAYGFELYPYHLPVVGQVVHADNFAARRIYRLLPINANW